MSFTSPNSSEEGLWFLRVHIVHETLHIIRMVQHSYLGIFQDMSAVIFCIILVEPKSYLK